MVIGSAVDTNFVLEITHILSTQKLVTVSAVDTNFMLEITHILSTQKRGDRVSRQHQFRARDHSHPEDTETW